MILILKEKASNDQLTEVTRIYPGYTKIVVDIKRNLLAAGGEYHIDCEQVLLADGSVQSDLWGGGYRFESREVDFMGLTNYKIGINHLSYEVTFPEIREQIERITRSVFD
jgi:hypothetical protein